MRAGYPVRKQPGHPKASGGWVYEHVLIAEAALGRPLPPSVEVHHVDEDTQNNANSNLVICQDKAYHKLLHTRTRTVQAGGDPDTQKVCSTCRCVRSFGDFNKASDNRGNGLQSQCRECSKKYNRAYVRPSDRAEVA